MTLQEFVSEAISSGKNRLTNFPFSGDEIPDRYKLTDWLEYNGFKKVDSDGILIYRLDDISHENIRELTENGKYNIYYTGKYTAKGNSWVSFGNENCIILLRTTDKTSFEPRVARIYNSSKKKYTEFPCLRMETVEELIVKYMLQ